MARITDIGIKELSLIFAEHKGEQWAPVNPDARILTVKGGVKDGVSVTGSESFLGKLAEKFRSLFGAEDVEVKAATSEGEEPYDAIAGVASTFYGNLQSALASEDAEVRKASVATAIDAFLTSLDGVRETDKAGRRHSAADQGHIDALSEAHAQASKSMTKMGNTLDAMKAHIDGLGAGDTPASDDGPDDSKAAVEVPAEDPADITENLPVEAVDDASKADVEAAPVEPQAPTAADLQKAVTDALASVRDEVKTQVEAAVTVAVATAKAEADAKLAEMQGKLDEAHATLKAVVSEARVPSSPGAIPTLQSDGSRVDPADDPGKRREKAKAALKSATTIGEVLKLQRAANQ